MSEFMVMPLTAPSVGLEFAQKAFILDEHRLLLVRKSDADPLHPGRWEVPGGRLHVAADLDLDDHIRREVWEEVGIKITPGPPFHLWQWFMPTRAAAGPAGVDGEIGGERMVRVVAAARVCRPVSVDVTMDNQVPGDHLSDAAWVDLAKLELYDLIPDIRPVVHQFLRLHHAA